MDASSTVPQDWIVRVTLRCGTPAVVRPIGSHDRLSLSRGLRRLSPQSRVQRFFYDKRAYSQDELRRLTQFDEAEHIALVLVVTDTDGRELDAVAVARCLRHRDDPELAEVAVTTVDEWQRHGIGSILVRVLAEQAWKAGIRRWQAVLLSGNTAIRKLLAAVSTSLVEHPIGGRAVEVIYALRPPSAV